MAFQRALEIRLLTELLGGSPMLPFLSCRAVLCPGARADSGDNALLPARGWPKG